MTSLFQTASGGWHWASVISAVIWLASSAGLVATLYVNCADRLTIQQKDTVSAQKLDEAKTETRAAREDAMRARALAEELQKRQAPRVIDRDAFLHALGDYPTGSVEIMYVKDDHESFRLSLEIRELLRKAKWTALEPMPIPQSDSQLPSAMSVGAQPSGITVVANIVSVEEASAPMFSGMQKDWVKTPYTVLSHAFIVSMGGVAGGTARDRKTPEGVLRVVVAPKSEN
jgi:hypothetical protein